MMNQDTALGAAKARVLVVDDTPASQQLLRMALHRQHEVASVENADEALRWIDDNGVPDAILLDILMPGMDGYELCTALKHNAVTADVPVIFLTAKGDPHDEVKGFSCGAVDYIVKPAPAAVVLARVNTHLELRRTQQLLASANRELEGEVAILESGMRGVATMGAALGKDAHQRLDRIQQFVALLGQQLQRNGVFGTALSPRILDKMVKAAVMYDMGKMGIPAHILHKPGALDDAEWAVMRTHAELGGQALQGIINEVQAGVQAQVTHEGSYSGPLAFLELARDMALYHHERWDGDGYPLGLRSHAIPLCARIVAVADVYDALLSRREHKAPWPRDEVVAHLQAQSGTQFDPLVIKAFVEVEPQCYETWLRKTDQAERY